jgi:hypothetical protein
LVDDEAEDQSTPDLAGIWRTSLPKHGNEPASYATKTATYTTKAGTNPLPTRDGSAAGEDAGLAREAAVDSQGPGAEGTRRGVALHCMFD